MQVEVTRDEVEFKPITVKFVIEDQETLKNLRHDLSAIADGDLSSTACTTDEICGEIANQLRPFLED